MDYFGYDDPYDQARMLTGNYTPPGGGGLLSKTPVIPTLMDNTNPSADAVNAMNAQQGNNIPQRPNLMGSATQVPLNTSGAQARSMNVPQAQASQVGGNQQLMSGVQGGGQEVPQMMIDQMMDPAQTQAMNAGIPRTAPVSPITRTDTSAGMGTTTAAPAPAIDPNRTSAYQPGQPNPRQGTHPLADYAKANPYDMNKDGRWTNLWQSATTKGNQYKADLAANEKYAAAKQQEKDHNAIRAFSSNLEKSHPQYARMMQSGNYGLASKAMEGYMTERGHKPTARKAPTITSIGAGNKQKQSGYMTPDASSPTGYRFEKLGAPTGSNSAVTIKNPPGVNKFAEKEAEALSTDFGKLRSTRTRANALKRMAKVYSDNPNVMTGEAVGVVSAVKGWLQSAGWLSDEQAKEFTAGQTLDLASGEIKSAVIQEMNVGSISEAEQEMYDKLSSNRRFSTPQGIQLQSEYYTALSNRNDKAMQHAYSVGQGDPFKMRSALNDYTKNNEIDISKLPTYDRAIKAKMPEPKKVKESDNAKTGKGKVVKFGDLQ